MTKYRLWLQLNHQLQQRPLYGFMASQMLNRLQVVGVMDGSIQVMGPHNPPWLCQHNRFQPVTACPASTEGATAEVGTCLRCLALCALRGATLGPSSLSRCVCRHSSFNDITTFSSHQHRSIAALSAIIAFASAPAPAPASASPPQPWLLLPA